VLDEEGIFKPLLSEYLTILSYSRRYLGDGASLDFLNISLMSFLLFLYLHTYLPLSLLFLFLPMLLLAERLLRISSSSARKEGTCLA